MTAGEGRAPSRGKGDPAPSSTPPPGTATYVYCLVGSAQRPAVDDAPAGLPGTSSLRLLPIAPQLWLAVATAPLPTYAPANVERHLGDLEWVAERALAHERMVEHFAGQGDVVPLKLLTLFSSDDRAEEHIRGEQERLVAILARIREHREWGLRVRLSAPAKARARLAAAEEPEPTEPGGPGEAFLRRKRRVRDAARDAAHLVRAAASTIYDELAEEVTEARRRPNEETVGSRLLLDAVFLVRVSEAERFERCVAGVAERLADLGCTTDLTGPWPPYSFVEPVS